MAITLTIGGVAKSWFVGSLRLVKALGQRSILDFTIRDAAGTYHPADGAAVELRDGSTLLFGGKVYEPKERRIENGVPPLEITVPANDWYEITDRRLVPETYTSKTAGYIVRNIITNYLAGDGITAGTIQDGPTLDKVVFDYLSASECLDELAELTGFQWRINPDKSLDFFDRATWVAPWGITDSTAVRNVSTGRVRDQYRNRQYIRSDVISDTQIYSEKGDGQKTAFSVAYPVAEVPTVTVDGIAKTIGIRGVETGKDWYWSKNDKTISQDVGGAPLTSAQTITISYKGFYRLVTVSDSPTAITERQAAEGGSGIYERIESKPSAETTTAALEAAEGLLRRFARITDSITYETYLTGLEPGMIQHITLPAHGLNDDFLISRVEITDPGRADGLLLYRVTAVTGEAEGGWVTAFRRMAEEPKSLSLRANEVLTRMVREDEPFTWSETVTVTINACPFPSNTTYPDSTLYPC